MIPAFDSIMSRPLVTAIIVICGSILSGCSESKPEPGVYKLSVAEAYGRLSDNTLEELVLFRQCGILIHVKPEGRQGQQVIWRVYSSGKKVVEFSAALTALDDQNTKVTITFPTGPDGAEPYNGSQSYNRPAFNQPLRPAVEEQVAALLEGRPYDAKKAGRGQDNVCSIQRGGLENGLVFRVDDKLGTVGSPRK